MSRSTFLAGATALSLVSLCGSPAAQFVPWVPGGKKVPTPDPGTHVEHEFIWSYDYEADNGAGTTVMGRVAWPLAPDLWPAGVLPLVLITHGDDASLNSYGEYDHLLEHFAHNGFIAASIDNDNGLSNTERAHRVRVFLDGLRNDWYLKDYVANNIALIGHSRGGEAVLTAARLMKDDWGLDHDVNAIISLAPTDGQGDPGEPLESLSGTHSPAFLAIYGTHDEDVYGECIDGNGSTCLGDPSGPQRTAFSLYDRAGTENSTDLGFATSGLVTKSMVYLEGGSHGSWLDTCVFSCVAPQVVARAYMNAFLRWQLRGETVYQPFLEGTTSFPSVEATGAELHHQSARALGRRVIDNFEGPLWNVATLGSVENSLRVAVVHKGEGWSHGNYTIPHDTGLMILRWNASPWLPTPWIRWTILDAHNAFGQSYRNVVPFDHLSLRVGQMHGAPYNASEQPLDFSVRLRDESGAWSTSASIQDYVDLDYPTEVWVEKFGQDILAPKSAMETARIPLSAFQGVDLSAIADIELLFDDAASSTGEILIDSLQFTD